MSGRLVAAFFLGVCIWSVSVESKTIKKKKKFKDYHLVLKHHSNKSDDTTLIIHKKNQSYSFYDQQKKYVISIKNFTVSKEGLLSLTVPFDDGHDYTTQLQLKDLETMATEKNGKHSVALSHDTFYR